MAFTICTCFRHAGVVRQHFVQGFGAHDGLLDACFGEEVEETLFARQEPL